MGEKITITAIELIDQENGILLQIDIWYADQNKGERMFMDLSDFFKMAGKEFTTYASDFNNGSWA